MACIVGVVANVLLALEQALEEAGQLGGELLLVLALDGVPHGRGQGSDHLGDEVRVVLPLHEDLEQVQHAALEVLDALARIPLVGLLLLHVLQHGHDLLVHLEHGGIIEQFLLFLVLLVTTVARLVLARVHRCVGLALLLLILIVITALLLFLVFITALLLLVILLSVVIIVVVFVFVLFDLLLIVFVFDAEEGGVPLAGDDLDQRLARGRRHLRGEEAEGAGHQVAQLRRGLGEEADEDVHQHGHRLGLLLLLLDLHGVLALPLVLLALSGSLGGVDPLPALEQVLERTDELVVVDDVGVEEQQENREAARASRVGVLLDGLALLEALLLGLVDGLGHV